MKRFLLVVFIGLYSFSLNACEICGCGVGNYYLGILPQFDKRFIGLRYQFNSFRTRLVNDPTQFSKDFYQTVELWSGWNIGKRFQVLAFVPFNINHQVSDEGITDLKGLGDIALLGNYKVFDLNSMKGSRRIAQQLWLGAGIKLPTGKFEIDATDPDLASLANTQVGSGSTDLLVNAMYNIHINQLGINTSATYKNNTVNKDDYKFGNKFSANSFIYYTFRVSNFGISPNLGLMYEQTGRSKLKKDEIDLTGGKILQGSLGAEFGFNKVTVGFNTQLPVAQNFAENQTKAKVKGMVHVSFAF
jgi:hypothetical protein